MACADVSGATHGRPKARTWLITGATGDTGRRLVEAALARGDNVAALTDLSDDLDDLAARHGGALLRPAIDIADRSAVAAGLRQVREHFGRLDVVVCNTGSGVLGAVEELAEPEVRSQFDANFFGTLWVIQAALPWLRAAGGGRVLIVSGLLGLACLPGTGGYSASKAAIEALAESLASEVAAFGIRVTVVEPGPLGSDLADASACAAPLAPYAHVHAAVGASLASMSAADPDIVGPALLSLVDADDPPPRFFIGSLAARLALHLHAERLRTWRAWAEAGADCEDG